MKKCLIIENSYKKDSAEIGKEIDSFLVKKGISVSHCVVHTNTEKVPFEKNDFVITLGGDGTVLFASRGCAPLDIPVFPVNLGQFGFIAGVQKNTWKNDLELFLQNKLLPVGRNMIQVDIVRNNETVFSSNCLNDVVISSLEHVQMLSFEVMYNTSLLGDFKSDGLILSTGTGSTAYSVSAGGPIIDPELEAFVLTSVNPFSLSVRPVVFNPEGKMVVKILPWRNNSGRVVIDGQKIFDVTAHDVIAISKAPHKALLIGCSISNFCDALRSKLNWAGGPHA